MTQEARTDNQETLQPSPQLVIFTDYDSTLLDHRDYSFEAARAALAECKRKGVPIVGVTSKTYPEVAALQRKMGLWRTAPVVIENGGASYIPEYCFGFPIEGELPNREITRENGFVVIKYGKPYEEVREVLSEAARRTCLMVLGIGDMSDQQFADETGLTIDEARLGKRRQYQEGFKILVPEEEQRGAQERIRGAIEGFGFNMTVGGRFVAIMGGNSKVEAVRDLKKLSRRQYPLVFTLGLGDSRSDLAFLEECDEGYLVANPYKAIGVEVESPKIHILQEEGPRAWNKVVLSKLSSPVR